MTQYNHPVDVPIRVDALWSDAQPYTAPPTTDFTRLQQTVPQAGENFSNAEPWLGDTVRLAPDDQYTLAAGLHLHWTLPQALRHGTTVYVLDYAVFNELVQQGVPCTLVQSLRNKATIGAELTLSALTEFLNGLALNASFTPLSGGAFTPEPHDPDYDDSTQYKDLISSDSDVEAYSYTPDLSWDPIFVELYGPLIVQAAARMKLPPVPNRWLVLRAVGGGEPSAAWVVESDRLSTPNQNGTPPAGAGPTAVPRQFDSEFVSGSKPVTTSDAFQFLGLTTSVDEWHEHDENAAVLSPLTAAGSGLVDFAAFYPNCQGVFGICDTTADKNTAYTYTIVGWFSDPANDPAAPGYNVAPWASERVADRFASFGWQVPADSHIDGSVYTAKISVTGARCAARSPDESMTSVKVAIGNTAGEALAAYLAKDSTLTTAWGLTPEKLLDAAQAGALRRVLEADGPAVVEQALHEQAFQPRSGGFRWEIVPLAPTQPGLSVGQTPLPQLTVDVETALSALNTAQLQFDRTQAYLTAQRRLLFTDWCRALHLETDASGVSDADPNATTMHNGGTIQIGVLAANLVNQSAEAVDAAGMGDSDPNWMLGYWAAKALYLAHAAALGALTGMSGGDRYTLERRAAPRFYQPNDPAVLLCDEGGGSSPLTTTPADSLPTVTGQGGDNETWLKCSVVTASNSPAAGLPGDWPAGPSTYCVASVQSSVVAVQGAQSWRPISLTWEARCFPYPEAGKISKSSDRYSVTKYASSFISDNFQLDAAGVDLVARSTATADTTYSTYNGRVVLSDHANTTLRARILQLAGEDTNSPPATLDPRNLPGALGQGDVAKLLTQAYANNYATLAQALDGFNDRLLMLRRIPQLSLFDCGYETAAWSTDAQESTWDPDSQSFYVEVGRQHDASPQQSDVYSPIRAGKCELTNLWLVDAFGQTRKWSLDTDNLTIASTLPDMTANVQRAAPAFLLPPRLAQPSRLLFRWVAADGSGVESVDHASTSPICGWVMLNRVDETLLFFAKDGTLLGWVPTQGSSILVPWPPKSSASTIDPLLMQVIDRAQAAPGKMYDDIATALLTIEPRAHRQHRASSVLFSRPLALACATLGLEVLGVPAPHQGYEWLATAPLDENQNATTSSYCPVQAADGVTPASPFPQRETCDFEAVTFPVRLGDVSMDDDGLVAYWTVDPSDKIAQSYCLVDPATGEEPTLGMTVDPAAPATCVLLLLDPRAPVHAVSGILPTKVIDIPPEIFTSAVKNMALLLTVGPVLSPAEADPPLFPLPTEIGGGWRWTEGTTTSAAMTRQIDDRAHLSPNPPVLREGWLWLPGGEQ
jgi:hypothetical protein